VDCGDGSALNTGVTGNFTCSYAAAGIYIVRIKDNTCLGTGFPRIYINNRLDQQKLLTVEQWGKGKWTSMAKAFYDCRNLTLTADDSPVMKSPFSVESK
jgi:hypothetical protein